MHKIVLALALSFGLIAPATAQNYQATAGTGTTFGTKLVSAINYPQMVLCDPVTPAQCVVVDASGRITVNLAAASTIAVTQAASSVASGAYSAGSFAAGALAASSLASGAGVDGWDLTQGAKADALCTVPTSTTACSVVSILKALTNVANSATPACAAAPCVTTIGDVGVDVSSGKGTPASAAINVSTATTTQIVALSGSTKIYVTSFDVMAGGTGNITFEYGTGASCGTGTTVLTGAYPLTAQAGISKGSGVGAVLIVPAGNALCVLTSAAVQMSGSVSYQQF